MVADKKVADIFKPTDCTLPADGAGKCDGLKVPDLMPSCDGFGPCGTICTINGTQYSTGTKRADNCGVCDPSFSRHSWKPMSGCVVTLAGSTKGTADGEALKAEFTGPAGLAVDYKGDVFVADSAGKTVRRISRGVVSTIAGNGTAGKSVGPALGAVFMSPRDVAVDSAGTVYVADSDSKQVRSVSCGKVSVFAGYSGGCAGGVYSVAGFSAPMAIHRDCAGTIYVSDYYCYQVRRLSGGTVDVLAGSSQGFLDGPAKTAKFHGPVGMDSDGKGKVYVADKGNHLIRLISGSSVTTFAGRVTGDTTPVKGDKDGSATKVAELDSPHDVVVVPKTGKVYFIEKTCLRVVHNGIVTTLNSTSTGKAVCGFTDKDGKIAGVSFKGLLGLTRDSAGRIYISDSGSHKVKVYQP